MRGSNKKFMAGVIIGCRNKCLWSRRYRIFSSLHLAIEISPTGREQVLPSLRAGEGDITVFRVNPVLLPTQLPFLKSRCREKMFSFHLLSRAWWAHKQETSTFKCWTRPRSDFPLYLCFLQQLPWTEAHSVKLIFTITSFLSSLSGKVVASGSGWPVSNPPELLQSQIMGTHQMRVGWPKAGVAEVAAYIFFLVILRNFSSKANCLKSVLKQSGNSRQTATWLHITKTPAKGEDPNKTARCQGGERPRPRYSHGKCQSTEALTWESSVQTPRELLLSAASHPILQRYDPPTHVDIVLQKACVFLLCW